MGVVKPKILVVEDVEIAQKMAAYILDKHNCDVKIASMGSQALELIKQQAYQLILMDLGLPDIDGLTITEVIRTTENNNQHTPIIALTAHSDTTLQEQCFKIGMQDFLIKPLTSNNIVTIFDKFINQNTGKFSASN